MEQNWPWYILDSYKIVKRRRKMKFGFTREFPIIFSKSGEQHWNRCQTSALPVGPFDSLIIEQLLIPDIGG